MIDDRSIKLPLVRMSVTTASTLRSAKAIEKCIIQLEYKSLYVTNDVKPTTVVYDISFMF